MERQPPEVLERQLSDAVPWVAERAAVRQQLHGYRRVYLGQAVIRLYPEVAEAAHRREEGATQEKRPGVVSVHDVSKDHPVEHHVDALVERLEGERGVLLALVRHEFSEVPHLLVLGSPVDVEGRLDAGQVVVVAACHEGEDELAEKQPYPYNMIHFTP
eukprot:XP_001706404.1 Hypothetical protein GL50803_37947 [Giardia lamblia ATCC 50803]